MTAKRLENLLNPCKNGDLGNIVQRAQELGALTEALARAVGPVIERVPVVSTGEGVTLRLKFYQPGLYIVQI